jgi:MFS family permease
LLYSATASFPSILQTHSLTINTDQGVMGGLLTLPSFLQHFPQIDTANPPPGSSRSHASNIQGITVGGYTLGCFFGAVATIWLGNFLGRKRTIIIGSVIMIIGATIQASSFGLSQLIPGRLITGFGNGMNTSTVPTWQAETSKSHRRGQMVMIEVNSQSHFCSTLTVPGIPHRLWCYAILLDRFRLLFLRTQHYILAVPHRLSNRARRFHSLCNSGPSRIAALARPQGQGRRGLGRAMCVERSSG